MQSRTFTILKIFKGGCINYLTPSIAEIDEELAHLKTLFCKYFYFKIVR